MGETKAGAYGLAACGLANVGRQAWNPGEAALVGPAAAEGEPGAPLTGDDRFVVQSVAIEGRVAWSEHNRPFSPTTCSRVWGRVQAALQGRDVVVVDGFAGTDPDDRIAVRVVADRAIDALQATRWLQPAGGAAFLPELTAVVAAGLQASPEIDGTAGRRFGILDIDRGLVLIGGPCAPTELSDAIAKAAGFARSREGVLALPGAAGVGDAGAALFLGPSGTGRTTLASSTGVLVADGALLWTGEGLEPLGPGRAAGHPAHVAILVADATGTLPALARLTPVQAAAWFAAGYAAQRDGVATGETADAGLAFSAGCGARFHVVPPAVAVDRLLAKLHRHAPSCWLVDTGWPDGAARRPVAATRALLADAFAGRLGGGRVDPTFGFEVPAGVAVGTTDGAGLRRRFADALARIPGLDAAVRGALPAI